MISFKSTGDMKPVEIARELSAQSPELEDEISEIVGSFSDFFDSCEFGFCLFSKLLLVRIYDGESYAFVYPIALTDGQDEREALSEIGKYAVKEEIPLIFCDVPSECIPALEECFRFTECLFDEEEESCTARVLTELQRTPDIPHLSDGTLTLSPITEADIPLFGRLSGDGELNKYWGYDYRADKSDATDEYFYSVMRAALDEGTALSLGVRHDGKFIGEGVIWGFDLHGSATLAFRLLPEYHGRGFGKRTLLLLLELGGEIGLSELCASVMTENIPSKKILDKYMVCTEKGEKVNKYLHKY